MPKYLVISYDNDEQQTFYDFVLADDEEKAQEIIGEIRDYALPVCAITPDEMHKMAQKIDGSLEKEIQEHVENLVLNTEGAIEEDDTVMGWHKKEDGTLWHGSIPEEETHCPCGNLDCIVCGGNANWKPGDPDRAGRGGSNEVSKTNT